VPIVSSDITRRYSGGAGNTDPLASLGGAKSSTAIPNNTLNAVWPDFTGQESNDGITRYRCFYIHNAHGSLTAKNGKLYFNSQPANAGVSVEAGAGTSAVNGTEQTIANETTAPSGVTFNAYNSGTKLSLANIPAGQHKAIWLKLTTDPGASAKDLDQYELFIDVDTNE